MYIKRISDRRVARGTGTRSFSATSETTRDTRSSLIWFTGCTLIASIKVPQDASSSATDVAHSETVRGHVRVKQVLLFQHVPGFGSTGIGTFVWPSRLIVMSHASTLHIIRVTVNEEPSGVLVASSPDLPGVLAVALDAQRLSISVPERIRAWFQAEGRAVHVVRDAGLLTALSTWKVEPVQANNADRNALLTQQAAVT